MSPSPQVPPGSDRRLHTLAGLAAYGCGHSGSCCRAGWPVPVEPQPLRLLQLAQVDRRFALAGKPLVSNGLLTTTAEGLCPHHQAGTTHGCGLETALGSAVLPDTCRQFPRILLADDRGWHQSLSAWCVTAAHLILQGGGDFLSFDHIHWDARVHRDALDARGTWPPLLRPGVLMGLDAYEGFERRAVEGFFAPAARHGSPCRDTLGQLLQWVVHVRAWRPSVEPLESHLNRSWPSVDLPGRPRDAQLLVNDLLHEVPAEWRPSAWPGGLTDADMGGPPISRGQAESVLHRYLGTRLIGSWIAYQGEGVLSVCASLVSSYVLAAAALAANGRDVVTSGRMASALRAADWLQLHLMDREAWAGWCRQWEVGSDGPVGLSGWIATGGALLDGLGWASGSPSLDDGARGDGSPYGSVTR